MNDKAEVVLPHKCRLGEGPVWDAHTNTIMWLDILQGEIHRYQNDTMEHKTFNTGQMVGAIVLRKSGGLVAAMRNGFNAVDLDEETVQPIADPEADIPGNRFNDGKCDPLGRFLAGSMSLKETPGAGSLYRLDKDMSVSKIISGTTISNGMAWSPDLKYFYYVDTPSLKVARYDYDKATGNISNPITAITIAKEDGHPDGMTIDEDGMLWIAHWDGWQVTQRNPHTGELLRRIKLPVSKVTCCTFGGKTMTDLYISSGKDQLSEQELKEQPLSGALFVVKNCGAKGRAPFEFGG